MFNPKSPLSAAAIFLAGIAAIAYTTLDIQRTLKSNEQPTTPEQLAALRDTIDHHDRKAAGLCMGHITILQPRPEYLSQATVDRCQICDADQVLRQLGGERKE